jgi:hypothetical protein
MFEVLRGAVAEVAAERMNLRNRVSALAARQNVVNVGHSDINNYEVQCYRMGDDECTLVLASNWYGQADETTGNGVLSQDVTSSGGHRLSIKWMVSGTNDSAARFAFSQASSSVRRVFWGTVLVFGDQVVATGPVECFPYPAPAITTIDAGGE